MPTITQRDARKGAHLGAQLDGKRGPNVANAGESGEKMDTLDAGENGAQPVVLSVVGEEKAPKAKGGEKRRRPDSNRGWRICNPLP